MKWQHSESTERPLAVDESLSKKYVYIRKNSADACELIDKQNVIIKEQSDIINRLFLLLMNYMTPEETDNLPETKRINEVARLRREINDN